MTIVPWISLWTGEDGPYTIRPCRHLGGRLAVSQPSRPGAGKPLFGRRHLVRARWLVHKRLCQVCGKFMSPDDRWFYDSMVEAPITRHHDGSPIVRLTETPVHGKCAELSQQVCPRLAKKQRKPYRLPTSAEWFALTFNLSPDVRHDYKLPLEMAGKWIGGASVVGFRLDDVRSSAEQLLMLQDQTGKEG